MGYSIEVSFSILKNSSVTEVKNMIINGAEECGCDSFYEDYEFDAHTQFKRNHCVMTLIFSIQANPGLVLQDNIGVSGSTALAVGTDANWLTTSATAIAILANMVKG